MNRLIFTKYSHLKSDSGHGQWYKLADEIFLMFWLILVWFSFRCKLACKKIEENLKYISRWKWVTQKENRCRFPQHFILIIINIITTACNLINVVRRWLSYRWNNEQNRWPNILICYLFHGPIMNFRVSRLSCHLNFAPLTSNIYST